MKPDSLRRGRRPALHFVNFFLSTVRRGRLALPSLIHFDNRGKANGVEYLNMEISPITTTRARHQIERMREYRTALIAEAATGKLDVRTRLK